MAEKIGQILIRKGKINASQLREALRTQQFFGGYLGSHLINLGFIDEAALGETLSEIYRVPFAPFDSIRLTRPEVLSKVPATLAQRFRLVPIQIEGNRLHLAMLNPRDSVAINEVSAATGLNVTPWVAPEFRIIQALEKHYRLKKPGRGPIKVKEKTGTAVVLPPSEDVVSEPVPAPTEYRSLTTDTVGLDGHPLGATVLPELADSRIASTGAGPIPRSLEEWREAEEDVPARDRSELGEEGPHETPSAEPIPAVASAHPRISVAAPAAAIARKGGSEAPAYAPARGEPDRRTPDGRTSTAAHPAPPSDARALAGPDQLSETLAHALSRDDIAREVVLFMAGRFRRVAAFAVRQDKVNGWIGVGPGFDSERLRGISLPLASSVFAALQVSQRVYLGPVPGSVENHTLLAPQGGSIPPAILMIPVSIRDRLVTALYADNENDPLGPIDLALWKRVGKIMEVAFEIMILKNKMKQV